MRERGDGGQGSAGLIPWERARFAIRAEPLARQLLGAVLVRRLRDGEVLAGRIVETEAYVGVRDGASHAFGGRRTARNEAMWGPPGRAYVYFTYGLYDCMNIVCAAEGVPEAVLIRALEPIAGAERMRAMRMERSRARAGRAAQFRDRDLCSGPARLCQAMGIDRALNGVELCAEGELWVASVEGETRRVRAARSARIGIDYATGGGGGWVERPLRFFEVGNVHVSGGGAGGGMPKKERPG